MFIILLHILNQSWKYIWFTTSVVFCNWKVVMKYNVSNNSDHNNVIAGAAHSWSYSKKRWQIGISKECHCDYPTYSSPSSSTRSYTWSSSSASSTSLKSGLLVLWPPACQRRIASSGWKSVTSSASSWMRMRSLRTGVLNRARKSVLISIITNVDLMLGHQNSQTVVRGCLQSHWRMLLLLCYSMPNW